MSLYVEGKWWAVETKSGTLYNCKAETVEQAIQKVQNHLGSDVAILDAWMPSVLKGHLIDDPTGTPTKEPSYVTAGNEYYIETYDRDKKMSCAVVKILEVHAMTVFIGLYDECKAYLNGILDANFEEDYYSYQEYIEHEQVEINNPKELHEFIRKIDYIM